MSRTLSRSPTNARSPSAEPLTETATAPGQPDRRRQARRIARRVAWVLCTALVASLLVAGAPSVGAVPADGATASDASGLDRGATSAAIDADALGGAPAQANASFSREIYETTAGAPVEFTVLVEGETYLLVGGNRLSDSGTSVGFTDVIRLNPAGGSRMDVTLNTRVAGTGAEYVSVSGDGEATSCSVSSCPGLSFNDENGDNFGGLSDLSTATGAGGLSRPLAPERYRLAAVEDPTFTVTGDGVVSPAASAARSNVLVVESERYLGEEVDLFTTMPGGSIDSVSSLRSDSLERSAVTKGDRLVIGFEAAGIWGALSHVANDGGGPVTAGGNASGEVLRDLLAEEEGIDLRIEHTNPGRNREPTRIDASVLEDATVLFESPEEIEAASADPSAGRFYLVIDTSDDNAIGERLDPGEEYRVTFELAGERGERYRFADDPDGPFDAASVEDDSTPEQFPYFATDEAGVSVETTFSIQERYIEYDHHTDDGELFADGGEITGTTTLLPATELNAEFTYDGGDRPQLSESTVSIDDDGNFSADLGLSGAPPGDRVLFELRDDSGLRDSRTVIITADAADPHRLRLTNTTTNFTVTREESLSSLSTTIRNVGAVEDRRKLSLDVADGEIVEERYVTVGPDAPRNETFDGVDADLEPGTYPYTLAIDGDRINGTVIVEDDPAVTRIDSDGNGTSEASEPDGNGSVSDSNPGGEESTTDNGSDSAENSTSSTTSDGPNNGTEPAETNATDGTESVDDAGSGNGSENNPPSQTPPTDEPTTFLPFGIGTRETLVGTVVVGAIHILGHWV